MRVFGMIMELEQLKKREIIYNDFTAFSIMRWNYNSVDVHCICKSTN